MTKKRSHGDGALYPIRGGKLWRGVIDGGFDETGKRIQYCTTASTKTRCRDKLSALKQEIEEHGAPINKQTRLASWAAVWLETIAKPNVDPKTFSTYKSLTDRWIVPTLGLKKVSSLAVSDVRVLRKTIMDAGRSTSTARQAQVVLSEILDAAISEGLCRRNVTKEVKTPRVEKKDIVAQTRGAFTAAQGLAILEAAAALPNMTGTRWWFKLLGGPRQTEILGASLADLDLDLGTYQVNWKLEELSKEHGCAKTSEGWACGWKRPSKCPQARWRIPDGFEMVHLTGAWHLTRPKSRTGRITPLIPPLAEAMRRYLDLTSGWENPHGLIWRHEDGSIITPEEDSQQWKDLLVTAGIISQEEAVPGGTVLTGHWARHTTITVLASLGIDFQLIGEIVGQSSREVTASYRHASAQEKMSAMLKLEGVWGEALRNLFADEDAATLEITA